MRKTLMGIAMSFMIGASIHSTAFAADARAVLNAAELMPTKTGNMMTDELVESILSQIITPEMDTYSKVKACYDYIIQNTEYNIPTSHPQFSEKDSEYIERGADGAYGCLDSHCGVCSHYAKAFAALTRTIGLNCYCADGMTHKASGGMTGHTWNLINVGGTEYVFDVEVEDVIAKGGAIGYYRFCVTYDEVPGKYEQHSIPDYFIPFHMITVK